MNVLRMYPVFSRVGAVARAQLRTLCRTLRDSVRLITDASVAQRVIRRAWYRWRLYSTLCISSPFANASHWSVLFDDFNEEVLLTHRNWLARSLFFLNEIERFHLARQKVWVRFLFNFLCKHQITLERSEQISLQECFPVLPKFVSDYSARAVASHPFVFVMDTRECVFHHTYIELLGASGSGEAVLEVWMGPQVWFRVAIPRDTTALRIQWLNFSNIASYCYQKKLVLYNVSERIHVIHSGTICNYFLRRLMMKNKNTVVYNKPVFVEAFLRGDGSHRPAALAPNSGPYYLLGNTFLMEGAPTTPASASTTHDYSPAT